MVIVGGGGSRQDGPKEEFCVFEGQVNPPPLFSLVPSSLGPTLPPETRIPKKKLPSLFYGVCVNFGREVWATE